DQQEGGRQIHRLGISFIRHQSCPQAGQEDRSIAIFDITKVRGGSKLKFTQIGIPPSRYSGHYRGWIEAYWTPMKEIFATGVISDKTRRRVKIDREQRIRAGKFRRKISGEA